jgi:riboflavin kinase / FMN adenylyltransferase
MAIPKDFELENGVYASWVTINGTKFRGALHFGPIPTFDQSQKSLEVFLLGVGDHELSHAAIPTLFVEIIAKVRDIIKFPSVDALSRQIEIDVAGIRKLLPE